MARRKILCVVLLIIILIIYTYGILLIQPTFDDFTTLSSPNNDPNWLQYFLPFGPTWRPIDSLVGYINGINCHLFPVLNHIIVISSHILCVLFVYKLARLINVNRRSAILGSIFFFITPCTLGTVLSCDAINQSLCQLFGLASIFVYLTKKGLSKYILWIILIYLSALSKDNGISWACVAPLFNFARGGITKKRLGKEFTIGIFVAVSYAIIRLSFPYVDNGNHGHFDLLTNILYKFKSIGIWLGYTWSATDYICLFYTPQRNILIVAITFIISTPIMLIVFFGNKRVWKEEKTWILIICIIISASANLLIEMSVMNSYASLGMSAVLFSYLIDENLKTLDNTRVVYLSMILYIISAVFVDFHHWYMAWQTSIPSKTIAEKIVKQSHYKAQKALLITVKDKNPKYSSFCVPLDDVTGWGRNVWQETDYKWPEIINDTLIDNTSDAEQKALKMAKNSLKTYDAVWILINKDKVIVKEHSSND